MSMKILQPFQRITFLDSKIFVKEILMCIKNLRITKLEVMMVQ